MGHQTRKGRGLLDEDRSVKPLTLVALWEQSHLDFYNVQHSKHSNGETTTFPYSRFTYFPLLPSDWSC